MKILEKTAKEMEDRYAQYTYLKYRAKNICIFYHFILMQ